ncbi:MAG: hypothetical protein M1820_007480 [Bogoriella megaspora]|nr:MAG: hypothetical protein M1820_007480 [Bogoriella megaspora]
MTPESKKRKRESLPDEIDVDVNAPEPPSKKALRRAKKGKPPETAESKAAARRAASPSGLSSSPSPPPSNDESIAEDDTKNGTPEVVYGVWIGNLPFTCTSASLRTFLINSSPAIRESNIARLHMPAPAPNPGNKGAKSHNKGFSYVDFTTEEAQQAAIDLSETPLGGRNILVKRSEDFKGRPEQHANSTDATSKTSAKATSKNPPSQRVFIGNLSYDTTTEGLQKNYEPCGEILDVHCATFEDTGRSKGFAWIRFGSIEAAEAAVRGWCKIKNEDADGKMKTRKWFVNRMHGRELRCQFAESGAVRYEKRFGKKKFDNKGGKEMKGGYRE